MSSQNRSEYSIVSSNFFKLAFVQAVNLVLPLITIPYVISIVGLEKVGLIALATSVAAYFGVVINYGFNLTGTKAVAQCKNSTVELNEIFCNVTYSKIFLSVLSIVFFFILIPFVKDFVEHFFIYFFLILSVVFTNMSPDWFFQGVQELRIMTVVNVFLKILSTVLTFILLKEKTDYYYLAVIPLINGVLLFFITHLYAQLKFKFRYNKISFSSIFSELYAGRFVFLSQVKITFFSNFNILVLGLLTSDKVVGIFSSADKIIKVFSSVQVPMVTALFPHFAAKVRENRRKSFLELKKIALWGAAVYGALLAVLILFAPLVAEIMFGTEVAEIALLIRLMALIPVLVFVNNLYGTQYLLNTSNEKKFMVNLLLAALLNVLIIFPLTYFFGARGTAISVFTTEVFVLVAMFISAYKIFNKAHDEV